MVKINVNNFLNLLTNPDIKNKFGEMFNKGITKLIDKSNEALNKKIEDLTATIGMLRLELHDKDDSITQLKTENNTLKVEPKSIMKNNGSLQRELKRDDLLFTGFKPTLAEAAAEVGATEGSKPRIL